MARTAPAPSSHVAQVDRAGAGLAQDSQDTELALSALRDVARDSEAPAAARAAAARTLLEVRGLLGRHAAPPDNGSAPLSSLSAADLRAELARLRAVKRARAGQDGG